MGRHVTRGRRIHRGAMYLAQDRSGNWRMPSWAALGHGADASGVSRFMRRCELTVVLPEPVVACPCSGWLSRMYLARPCAGKCCW
jgi:hypothetical protein